MWVRRYCWDTKEYKQGLLRGKNKCNVRNAVQKYIREVGGKQVALQTALHCFPLCCFTNLFFFFWLHLSSSSFQVFLPQIQPWSCSCIISTPLPRPTMSKLWAAVSWQRTLFLDFCKGKEEIRIRMGMVLW